MLIEGNFYDKLKFCNIIYMLYYITYIYVKILTYILSGQKVEKKNFVSCIASNSVSTESEFENNQFKEASNQNSS